MDSRAETPIILIVTGDVASGKSSFCRQLARAVKVPSESINVGKLLLERLSANGKYAPVLKAQIGRDYIKKFGKEEISTPIKNAINAALENNIRLLIIDGIRLVDTYVSILKFCDTLRIQIVHVHIGTGKSEIQWRIKKLRARVERRHLRETLELESGFEEDMKYFSEHAHVEFSGSATKRSALKFSRALHSNVLQDKVLQRFAEAS